MVSLNNFWPRPNKEIAATFASWEDEKRTIKPAPNASWQNHTLHHARRWTQELSYWLPITLPRELFFFYVVGCLPTWSPWYIASGDSGQSIERLADRRSRTFSQEGCSHASLSEMLDGHGHHNGCGCYHMTVVRDSRSHFFSESLDHSVWIISE